MVTTRQSSNAGVEYDVPYKVHGTDASAIGGASPEMIKLTQMTMNTPESKSTTASNVVKH
jgi:hypothetical protein